jgi:hypothetical protein
MDIHLKKTLNSSESNPSNLDAINKHFDFDYLKSMAINILDPIDKYYFRSRLINFETVPERNNPRFAGDLYFESLRDDFSLGCNNFCRKNFSKE